jgi:hypothetical protein
MAKKVFQPVSYGLPPAMVDDLRSVAGLSERVIDEIANALRAEQGAIGPKRFREMAEPIVDDKRVLFAVWRILAEIPPDNVAALMKFIKTRRSRDEHNPSYLSEEALTQLDQKLPRLVQEYPGVQLHEKATRLATFLGNRATECDLICDLRPVFDEARERIDGVLPITTLRIEYETQSEDTQVIEFALPASMLEDLKTKIDKAQRKLSRMEEYATQQQRQGFLSLD